MYRSRKHQRRARRKVLFFRALVIALVLATALTRAWPLPPLQEIVQGVIITVAIMIPVCVYIIINKLWPQSAAEKRSEAAFSSLVDAPDLRPAHAQQFVESASTTQKHAEQKQPEEPSERLEDKPKESLEESLDELLNEPNWNSFPEPRQDSFKEPLREEPRESFKQPLQAQPQAQPQASLKEPPREEPRESFKEPLQESLDESYTELLRESVDIPLESGLADSPQTQQADRAQSAFHAAGKHAASKSLHSQSSEQESALDQTLSVGEQMETLDDLVDFHDIGDHDDKSQATGPYDPDAPPTYNPLEKAIAVARDAILDEPGIQDYSTENLPAKSRIELSEMVVRLRNDKMKLQKLVIAQKAVIDSEKQAHERTRVVVKDAISVMRHARHGQRIAEKIARRERAERIRLEKDYVKVRRALDNALSTMKTRSERSDVEKA